MLSSDEVPEIQSKVIQSGKIEKSCYNQNNRCYNPEKIQKPPCNIYSNVQKSEKYKKRKKDMNEAGTSSHIVDKNHIIPFVLTRIHIFYNQFKPSLFFNP